MPKARNGLPSSSCLVEDVGRIFQEVHRSAAHAVRGKKALLSLAKADVDQVVVASREVILLILKQIPQLSSDCLKRHYAFLTEVAKSFRESCQSDALAIGIMQTVLPFHNGIDKSVRLAVVSTFEALLKTVDQGNTSDERQDFYQTVAEVLKRRIHDRCPHTRERSIMAISAFQTGKRDCDVSQQLIALLCTDTCSDVRRCILRCIVPRKEFLEGYFHGMVRCTRDVVARVRAEAWDAMGRFPWRYITAYAAAKSVSLLDLLMQGLTDRSTSVIIACRAALTTCWLHRDAKDDCECILDPMVCGTVLTDLSSFDKICSELLTYSRKRNPSHRFQLNLQAVRTSSLLMWFADCQMSCNVEGEDESLLLLPLEQFCALFQDTVYAYARPDIQPKTVKFCDPDEADNMLRLMLAAFEIYDENAYLAHADNTTRNALLRLLSFLLKVVPDDDPALFVDVAVRSLKSLTARIPEEAAKTVTAALDSLFRSLCLPQRYALGFEDVEAIGRKSRERQQDLVRRTLLLSHGSVSQEEVTALKEEVDRDEKFFLRMQLIVLAFLSHSHRGDPIPQFCSHMIQLGRHLDNEPVRVASIRSLGLQCLISPDTVHTFMPIILHETHAPVNDPHMSVALAAIGVVFDLIMEYGLRFFKVTPLPDSGTVNTEMDLDARLQHERTLAGEDVHKVGSTTLLDTLLSYLQPRSSATNGVTIFGFCKLLSCNRLPGDSVPMILARLLLHYVRVQSTRKDDPISSYLYGLLNKFFNSYTASHPRRQEDFARGGMVAAAFLFQHRPACAGKLLEMLTRLTDAYMLVQVREIDPEAAKRITKESPVDTLDKATLAHNSSSRSTATRSSMQSGRLLRELSRYSLHELLAQELLLEMAERPSHEVSLVCLDVLEKRMYFYSKEFQPLLIYCAKEALAAVHDCPDEHSRLQAWLDELVSRSERECMNASAPVPDSVLETRREESRRSRAEQLSVLVDEGYEIAVPLPTEPSRAPVIATSKDCHTTRTTSVADEDASFFRVDDIVGSRKRHRT